MNTFEAAAAETRISGGFDKANRTVNAWQHEAMRLASAATRHDCLLRQAVDNESPLGSASPIRMLEETSQPHEDLDVKRQPICHRAPAARTHSRHARNLHAIENQRDSTGTRTYQGARLTFVKGSVQMFRHAADGGMFLRDRLLHQKTREHSGGGFVEPLFEECVNFLF
jgi:hypothetical protein